MMPKLPYRTGPSAPRRDHAAAVDVGAARPACRNPICRYRRLLRIAMNCRKKPGACPATGDAGNVELGRNPSAVKEPACERGCRDRSHEQAFVAKPPEHRHPWVPGDRATHRQPIGTDDAASFAAPQRPTRSVGWRRRMRLALPKGVPAAASEVSRPSEQRVAAVLSVRRRPAAVVGWPASRADHRIPRPVRRDVQPVHAVCLAIKANA